MYVEVFGNLIKCGDMSGIISIHYNNVITSQVSSVTLAIGLEWTGTAERGCRVIERELNLWKASHGMVYSYVSQAMVTIYDPGKVVQSNEVLVLFYSRYKDTL